MHVSCGTICGPQHFYLTSLPEMLRHTTIPGFPWRSANNVENYPRVSRNFSAQMTTFPTGSDPLSRTYFRPRWKETCGGHRTSRVVHGSLRDPGRFPTRKSISTASRINLPSHLKHPITSVSGCPLPLVHLGGSTPENPRETTRWREGRTMSPLEPAHLDERWIYWFLYEPYKFPTVRESRCKKSHLKIYLFREIAILRRNFRSMIWKYPYLKLNAKSVRRDRSGKIYEYEVNAN